MTIRLTPELHRALTDAAVAKDASVAQLVRKAIRDYLSADYVKGNK